jgi:two-component sensor histidine kinase
MIKKSWAFISNIGIKPEYDPKRIKRYILINQYMVIAIIIYLMNALTDLLYGYPFDALVLSGSALLFSVLVYFKKHHESPFILGIFIYISLTILYFGSFASIQAGDYLYYFPLVLAVSFAFDFKKDKRIMIFLYCFITLLLIVYALTYGSSKEINMDSETERYHMFIINLAISTATVGFFVYLTVEDNRINSQLYEQRLSEKEESEQLIKKTLAEKEVLLQELHHRVKNNLAVIVGYFNLKLNGIENAEARTILLESRNHVNSMALIHNRLYKTGNFSEIHFASYLKDLLKEIQESYPFLSDSVIVKSHIDDIKLTLNTAVPCALIMNELLTNCYKHAFKGDNKGIIQIDLLDQKNNKILLSVRDNGIGLKEDFDQNDSLGVSVIQGLSEQLNGTCRFFNDGGTVFTLHFNKE